MIKTAIHYGVLLLVLTSAIYAQPELDTTFSGDGKTTLVFGATASTDDMVIQPDNKIVLVSSCSHITFGFRPFCALRVNENGSIDSTFRSDAAFSGAYFGVGSDVTGVTMQSDGKIVAVGYAGGSNENIVIVRWNTDGTPDLLFGSGGSGAVITDLGENDRAKKVMMQPDGKILIVGRTGTSLFVSRYLSDGTPDASFGVGGVAKVIIGGTDTSGLSIASQADGKILAGGATSTAHLLVRFDSSGMLDTTWDTDGIVTIGSASTFENNGFRSIALQADGRVLALGHNNILYRLNTDGSPDMSFDGDGSRPALDLPNEPQEVMISPGGLITVVGEPLFSPRNFLTARYLSNGTPDVSYSGDGFLQIDVSSSDGAWAAAADTLGRIVVAGRSSSCCIQNPFEQAVFSVARLVAPPNAAVGISGRITGPDGFPLSRTIVSVLGGGGGRTTITNPFGYYAFENLAVGQLYSVTAHVKGLEFTPEVVFLGENIIDLDLEGQPGSLSGKSK